MAIKEIQMYYIECDNCGHMNDCDSDGHPYIYSSEKEAKERAEYEDMKTINDKQYCSSCWTYDDSGNLVIKRVKGKHGNGTLKLTEDGYAQVAKSVRAGNMTRHYLDSRFNYDDDIKAKIENDFKYLNNSKQQ